VNYKKLAMVNLKLKFTFIFFFFPLILSGYGLPSLNLGFTNILDGGPVRPNPGFYLQNYSIYYHAKNFLNAFGKPLVGLDGVAFNDWSYVLQFIYQFDRIMNLKGMPGISVVLPFTFYSAIKPNALKIRDAGGGPGSLSFGPYIQWEAVFWNERPFFIHRLSLDFIMPSLRNKSPKKIINPGEAFFSICPSWSGTLYAMRRLAFSWRLNYLWNSKSKKIDFKAGDAVFVDYSMEYELIPHLWTAISGYYLQQISDNKLNGLKASQTRERVFGLGPGAAYFFSQDLIFFGYFYKEFKAINRPEGVSFVLRLVKHF
jgi:hypothetical protein